MSRKNAPEPALAALKRARDEAAPDALLAEVQKALAHSHWLVVAEAAALARTHALGECSERLRESFARFSENGAKADPGCRAKEAALTALDHLEALSPEPFLRAVRYRQPEPAAGGSSDTAGGVRQRGLFALFRLCHPDALLFAGELLADADPAVRGGAIHALGHYGDRQAAALLVHKFYAGDRDGGVEAECAAALLSLAPDFALPALRARLRGNDERARESAALALGQSRERAALDCLIEWLEDTVTESDFELGVRALGLSRESTAQGTLLALVEQSSPARARAALEALATHRYDARLSERALAAAGANRRAELGPLAKKLFGA